jgi:hypothetical protein
LNKENEIKQTLSYQKICLTTKNGQTNYITNLDAWRIEQVSNAGTDQTEIDSEYMEPLDNFTASSPEAIDDLPF